jgi:beta-glucosidase
LAGVGLFNLVVRPVAATVDAVLADARAAAAAADVAVVVVGLTEEQETEAVDKSTIALPGDQDALVAAVAAVARRTVVVLNAATPVLMPWTDDVDAIVWAGLPGQEGGHAVAAALLGEIEPAGRLVTTFPAADGAAPAWEVVPTDGALHYSEGTAIGYRGHYAGSAPAPAFWFGHGLGYASWSYGTATLVAESTSPTVEVPITNTSSRDSREVVQVYLQPADTEQPVRLVGWSAADVAAGAQATVRVATDAKLWRRWDSTAHTWGDSIAGGELLVARGLGDIRARIAL